MSDTVKQLYDANSLPFFPKGSKHSIITGCVVSTNDLGEDLDAIWNKAQEAYKKATGVEGLEGQLAVSVYYANSNISDAATIKSLDESEDSSSNKPVFTETMNLPNATTPYCWKKTLYGWEIDEEVQIFKTTYDICATALYPETLIMYASSAKVTAGTLGGPTSYNDNSPDTQAENIVWNTYFEGIDNTSSKECGYMAVRHRDAGESWPEDGGWNVALFAQYPTTT